MSAAGAMRGRGHEVRVGLALAGATVAVCLGGAEIVARLTEPRPAAAPAAYITDWQAWEGDFYTVKSTAVGWPPWEDYNTEGLRDREHTLAKRPSAWRVACLGDSVTLGWGIGPEQAWPQVLEELAAAADRDLDVMNVALGGWATRQELIAYRRIVRRYRPDQVLLGICLNDVAEMQNNLARPPRLLAALYGRSALVRRLVGAREREIGEVEELFRSPDAPNVRRGYERMFADLRALRDEVHADGARFGILVFPFRFQTAAGAPPPLAQATVADFCRREEIPLLDLLPALAHVGEDAFHDYDHFSPTGARLVAQQVLESPLIPAEAGAGAKIASPAGALPLVAAGRVATDLRALQGVLRDPDEGRRAAAARALSTLGEQAAPLVSDLTAALEDHSPAVRAAAAWALGRVGPAAGPAWRRLLHLLQDANPSVRAGAAFALGGIASAATPATAALVERLADLDERVRWRAADALGKIGPGTDSVGPLVTVLRDAAGPGRGLAAEALGRVGPEARPAVPDLIEAVSDTRSDVRWRAVWAIGQIGSAAAPAVPVLRAALADADVRWRAAEALGGIGPPAAAAVPDLLRLLRDPSSSVRWRVATALGAIGARQAVPALAGAVGDKAENVRLAAVTDLVELRAEPSLAEPAFLAALRDSDSRVRQQAVRGLGRLGPVSRAARRGLQRASRDPDEAVRERAARVLEREGL
jgi:HEAT repeat protein/lysophospholipase L1-like esterase